LARFRRIFTDQQLIELHKQGITDREIAEKLGTFQSTVRTHRIRIGLKAHSRRLLFTDQQLIELYEKGLNDLEIGEMLGTAQSTVRKHRNRIGLETNRKTYTQSRYVLSGDAHHAMV